MSKKLKRDDYDKLDRALNEVESAGSVQKDGLK
jgi:hypothetical protein